MPERPTLRRRLTLAILVVASGVLFIAAGLTWLGVRGVARSAADDRLADQSVRLRDLTQDIQDRLGSAVDDGENGRQNRSTTRNAELLRQFIQLARGAQVSDARLVWVDRQGAILQGNEVSRRLVGQLERREPELVELLTLPPGLDEVDLRGDELRRNGFTTGAGNDLAHRADVVAGNDANHALAIVLTGPIDTATQRRVTTTFAIAALIALGLSAGASSWLARRLTRRIDDIDIAASAIAGGDLRARVAVDADAESELASLAGTINRMASDLEAARANERAFLMSISHDLRTPLTSIRGYAEALRDGTLDHSDPTERRRAADIITSEARRLERLVRDLLDLGRLDRREFSLHPIPIDLATLIDDTVRGFTPSAADHSISLTCQPSEPVPMTLDPERVAQIVANLIENALKFANGAVEVAVTTSADAVQIEVTDDGPGVAPDELSRVFERLHTVRSSPGRSVGTGLGLAIVRELALAMHGSVSVDNVMPTGSRFIVRLPR